MKEFPRQRFLVVNRFKQSPTSSTFVVKSLIGAESLQILKLYSGPSTRRELQTFEKDLCWQKGLVHPHLMGISGAGISGKMSLYTTRPFSSSNFDLAQASPAQVQQILDAVRFLHSHGRTHGRIKPSNIFMVDGAIRLADLRVMDREEFPTLDDIRFTAPEVLEGKAPTAESDFYSLGAILYRIQTARDPFDDSSPENLKAKYLHVKIPSIRDTPGVREPVARAIDGLLHQNPRRRANAFEHLLQEFSFAPALVIRVPMVGRSDILEQLHSRLSTTMAKTLSVSLIEGNAGIGKSRLVEELKFKSSLHGSVIHTSNCLNQSEPNLAPVLKLVRDVLQNESRVTRTAIPKLLGLFAENVAPLLQEPAESDSTDVSKVPKERVIQDLIGLLSTFSRRGPLRLCVEDIDRAEPATLAFLREICYRASELNVHLILTCRNATEVALSKEMRAVLGHGFTGIVLEPLATSASLDLIRYLNSNRVRQNQILQNSGGNPLWLLESARNESNDVLTRTIHSMIQEELCGPARTLTLALALSRGPASAELLARVVAQDLEAVSQRLCWLKNIGAIHELNLGFEMRMDALRSAIESEFSTRTKRTIHQAFYENLGAIKDVTEERLAIHAIGGGLRRQAIIHLSALARQATKRGDNLGALGYYEKVKNLLGKLNQEFPIESECEFAICLARTGKPDRAEQIYERLLTKSDIDEDLRIRLALLSRGGEIDCIGLDRRLKFLKQAIESSKYGPEHATILLSRLSTACVAAGDLVGAEDALRRAQDILKGQFDKKAVTFMKAAEGFLLMNRGYFRDASEIYRNLSCETWSMTAAILTNRGVCLEHLGNIRGAFVFQMRAYRLATKAGHLFARLQCMANLGTFKVKLGDFKEAQQHFDAAMQLAIELNRPTGATSKGIEAEPALLSVMEGRYDVVFRILATALNSEKLFKRERIQLQLLQCETLYSVGADIKTSDVEQIATEGSWTDSPLYAVQLALHRSRTRQSIDDVLSILTSALEIARKEGLLYEVCRLELEISARLQPTDANAAKPHSEEAVRIAKKNGYRPLHARALLLRGLCGLHNREMEHYLQESFKLASEIGIPEIISETAYHLGVLSQTAKRYAAAREYFATSTRIASDLADRVPPRFRSGYLSRPWRVAARKYYEEYQREQPIALPAMESAVSFKDHRYFRALYRISAASSSAQSVEEFLREMLHAIEHSRETIVVMLKFEHQTLWHSHETTVAEPIRQRVLSLAAKARGQARFSAQDRWIPIQSTQYSGGIYVLSRRKSQMAEDEMEFFTILGAFVSLALDPIHNRVLSRTVIASAADFHGIVGNSRAIRDVCAHIAKVSLSNATVLIQGETGTGKELVARAIHNMSARARAPFIAVDCGAIPEGLIESELFGSKRGSFTGAIADRPGVFEAAHQGTLFLDEISNMNMAVQAKLLRVIQEREIRRVGETRSRRVDVRLIAASNMNLKQHVADGSFRQDLLFRLNVLNINIPPLRARREDIPLLAAHFLGKLNAAQNAKKIFGPEVFQPLIAHSFPGNIRELQNSVERGFFTATGRIITSMPVESPTGEASIDEVRKWLAELAEGRRNFWTTVHDRYKRRDISREKVVALIDLGLRTTRGSYKNLASLLRIDPREYRRLMDFLRRNNCLLDFRPYRKDLSVS